MNLGGSGMGGNQSTAVPRWMRGWLIAAAAYNIAWGIATVAAPVWTLRALGVTAAGEEVWPRLWACIGMIVGVYGVGYAIASRAPVRHWPIVLVGLLGKILGPIGFVDAAVRGELPWSMGMVILTNDVVWWAPFAMILWHAALAAQPALPEGMVPIDVALTTLKDQGGRTLREATDERPMVTVLLRHAGCTFCRQALADLAGTQDAIERAGFGLAVVGMSPTAEALRTAGEKYGLRKASWFADPDRVLYRALELGRGTFGQLFGPVVWFRGTVAALRGHGIGKLEGDGFQMPGAFVIHRGRVLREYRHATAADRPDYAELACPIS